MSLTKRSPRNDQEKPTYSPHIHSDFEVFTATTFLPEATLVAKLFQQAFCSYLSLCWYPVSEHCGLCCKHYVIIWVFLWSKLPHLFHHYTFSNGGKETQDIRHQWETGTVDIGGPMTLY